MDAWSKAELVLVQWRQHVNIPSVPPSLRPCIQNSPKRTLTNLHLAQGCAKTSNWSSKEACEIPGSWSCVGHLVGDTNNNASQRLKRTVHTSTHTRNHKSQGKRFKSPTVSVSWCHGCWNRFTLLLLVSVLSESSNSTSTSTYIQAYMLDFMWHLHLIAL